jgi:selenocysteine lyase/cysteine desulfurase
MIGRRSFIITAAALVSDVPRVVAAPIVESSDEIFWSKVASDFDIDIDPIPLENGNWGVMARPVLREYLGLTEMVNRRNTSYARSDYPSDMEQVRARVARTLGVDTDEIALTRNATEALQALIAGYGKLAAGDEVLMADLDYPAMQDSMRWLQRERGVGLVELAIPESATWQGLIDFYEAALTRHPRVRLMLLTQLGHRTGLILPIREIVAMARSRGVDCIVDSAHAFGQLDTGIASLGADFVGFNLHKWFGAPIGCGGLYVAKRRLGEMRAHMDSRVGLRDVRQLVHSGTSNFAAVLAVPSALDYRERIGGAAIESRLRYLRRRWVTALQGIQNVEVLDSTDSRMYAGIGAFRIANRRTSRETIALTKRLRDEFRVMTVHRDGAAAGSVIRVSPGIFTRPEQIDRFIDAVKILAAS